MASSILLFILGLLKSYGIFGLFIASFLTSLIFFPGMVEFSLPILISLKFDPFLLFLSILLGSVLGGICNYYFGYAGYLFLIKKEGKEVRKVKKWLNKWGSFAIFAFSANPLPFPYDVLCVLAGIFKMDFKIFLIAMTLGKVMKYSFFILLSMFGMRLFLRYGDVPWI